MPRLRAFASFDFDHDEALRNLLIGQSRNQDSPFDLDDWSVKEHLAGDWESKVRERIRRVDIVIVICGEHTDTARGVSVELRIAQEERKPYFLLWGLKERTCVKPKGARPTDKIYRWTWDNLKGLLSGTR